MRDWALLQRKTHCYVTPFIEQIGKVFAKSVERVWFEKSFHECLVYYQKGVMHWYGRKKIVGDTFHYISKKIIKNPSYRKEIHTLFEKKIKKLLLLSEKIRNEKLASFSGQQLWQLYKKYIDLYEETYIYSEPLPLATSEAVIEHLRNELAKKIPDKNQINELMTTLTTPKERSFIRKEEEDFLKLAREIQNDKKVLTIFRKYNSIILRKKIEKRGIFHQIEKHYENYCWIPYDYGVIIWDLPYFLTSLQKTVLKSNTKNELKKKKVEHQELEKRQNELSEKYNLSAKIKNLFIYVQWATYMMDYKKELFTKSHYLVIPLIEELARRAFTTNILVRFMRHEEIKEMLLQDKALSQKELEQRYQNSILVWDKEGATRFMGDKEKKKFIRENVEEKEETTKVTKIYGVCASVGKCKGKVKVVRSAMHVLKVEEGDILVAPMTSPDYVIGMKKAAAIITDEGGLTSHAAIVARELKIPCVVGTKNATKLLKDGDIVEINANHGSITIVNSARKTFLNHSQYP